MGHEQTQFVPPYPSMGQGNRYQFQGVTRASGISQTGKRGQSIGRGQGQSVQAITTGTKGHVYVVTPQTG